MMLCIGLSAPVIICAVFIITAAGSCFQFTLINLCSGKLVRILSSFLEDFFQFLGSELISAFLCGKDPEF